VIHRLRYHPTGGRTGRFVGEAVAGTLRRMQREQILRRFGWVGLVTGLVALAAGPMAGELGSMLAGYGTLVLLSAAYLLAGLAIRDRVRRRTRAERPLPLPASAARR